MCVGTQDFESGFESLGCWSQNAMGDGEFDLALLGILLTSSVMKNKCKFNERCDYMELGSRQTLAIFGSHCRRANDLNRFVA